MIKTTILAVAIVALSFFAVNYSLSASERTECEQWHQSYALASFPARRAILESIPTWQIEQCKTANINLY